MIVLHLLVAWLLTSLHRLVTAIAAHTHRVGIQIKVTYLVHPDTGFIQASLSKFQGLFKTILQFSRNKSLGKTLI